MKASEGINRSEENPTTVGTIQTKTKSNNKQSTKTKGEEPSTSLLSKLSEEELEIVIIEKLNKSLDNANIRLAIDFMKIKKTFSDLDQDLDIEKFLKRMNA